MEKQIISKTNLEASRIALGCMTMGGKWQDENLSQNELEDNAVQTISAALEEGINFFDHADIYARGNSERVFSKIWEVIPGLREKIILQTKCGIRFANTPNEGDPGRYDFSYGHIINSVNASLDRLKTDYIDILLLHRPDPLIEPEEVAKAFDELRSSGKVRNFGVSNHTGYQIELLKKYLNVPLVANQMEINVLHSDLINSGVITNQRNPDHVVRGEGTIDYCRLNELTIQAWSPLALGKVSGNLPQNPDEVTLKTAQIVEELANQNSVSKEAIVLAWLLKHPAKIQPIVGTRNIDRIKASCQAVKVNLTREEWYKLFVSGRGSTMP